MRFTKMHGAGNDFIIINNMDESIPAAKLPELARRLCAQRVSVGADGMMVLVPAKNGGDFGMLFYNSDGSVGEMCGNGARCICRYGFEKGLASDSPRVETTAGIVSGERLDSIRYRIRLNDPNTIDIHRSVRLGETEYDCAYVELGDPGIPHCIVELPGFSALDRDELRKLGRALRFAPEFPRGANVSFVDIKSRAELDIITFERGVEDFTLACGTGCGSAATALYMRDCGDRKLLLHAPGGDLQVELTIDGCTVKDIFLSGPTCIVFEAELSEEILQGI